MTKVCAIFNTFPHSLKVFMHSVCLSVRSLILVKIPQMSWHWYILIISDITWTVIKMVCIRQMVCLQRHTKVFRYISDYGRKCLKRILTYLNCTKYSEIRISHSHIQSMFSIKNKIKSTNVIWIGSQKSFKLDLNLCGKYSKCILTYLCGIYCKHKLMNLYIY